MRLLQGRDGDLCGMSPAKLSRHSAANGCTSDGEKPQEALANGGGAIAGWISHRHQPANAPSHYAVTS